MYAVTFVLFFWQEELQQIREQYIWNWILDVDNIHRHHKHDILQYYGVFVKS